MMVTCSDLKASKVATYFFFVKCSRRRACGSKAQEAWVKQLSSNEQLLLAVKHTAKFEHKEQRGASHFCYHIYAVGIAFCYTFRRHRGRQRS
jgi:hypothetical protein